MLKDVLLKEFKGLVTKIENDDLSYEEKFILYKLYIQYKFKSQYKGGNNKELMTYLSLGWFVSNSFEQ